MTNIEGAVEGELLIGVGRSFHYFEKYDTTVKVVFFLIGNACVRVEQNPFDFNDWIQSNDLLPIELGVNQLQVLTAEILSFIYLFFFTSGTV